MADSDKTLRIQIALELLGKGDIEGAKDALQSLKKESGDVTVSSQEVSKTLQTMGESASEAGKGVERMGESTEAAGEKALGARTKHLLLHHAFEELNKIIPGLGTIVHVLERQFDAVEGAAERAATGSKAAGAGAVAAGAGAAAAVPGVAAFGATLEAALAPLLPFIAAMLAIQEATNLWESFSESSKAAAEANAEACKKIQESTHAARMAVEELDEAMHPKQHNQAEQDEETLKKQQRDLDNDYKRQQALNKAAEENELQGASSPGQKEAIREKFALLDKQLEDWRDHQRAAIEGAMAGTMDAQLKQLQDENEKTVKKMPVEYQYGLATGDYSRYNASKDELEKNAAAAKALREKRDDLGNRLDDDSTNANYNSETNRQVYAARGKSYSDQGLAVADFESTPAGQMLMALGSQTGKTNQQIVAIIIGLLNHTLNLSTVLSQLQWQLNQQQSQINNGAMNFTQ